ncbi:MAG: hypothetical protein HY842_10305 [Bacteroidetes bacterium]|nr:hypothetical protein [Bacteroidota bacterium]
MKTYLIFLLAFVIAFAACKKPLDEILPTPQAQIEMEKTLQEQLDSNAVLSFRYSSGTVDPDCSMPVCSLLIQEQNAILQAQANELCQPVFNCVECCLDGWLVFATLYVEPTAPKCKILDWNSYLLENL